MWVAWLFRLNIDQDRIRLLTCDEIFQLQIQLIWALCPILQLPAWHRGSHNTRQPGAHGSWLSALLRLSPSPKAHQRQQKRVVTGRGAAFSKIHLRWVKCLPEFVVVFKELVNVGVLVNARGSKCSKGGDSLARGHALLAYHPIRQHVACKRSPQTVRFTPLVTAGHAIFPSRLKVCPCEWAFERCCQTWSVQHLCG